MRRYTRFFSIFLLAAVATISFMSCVSAQVETKQQSNSYNLSYTENSTSFPNPERGWYPSIQPNYSTNSTAEPLTLNQLQNYRKQGITLVEKVYLLYKFRKGNITEDYLNSQLIHDFNVARQAGVKLIPRFVYNWNLNFESGAGEDASVTQILSHLEQLKPTLAEHYDVIDHMRLGLVGAWGEWHSSSNGNVGTANEVYGLNNNSKAIINKLLEVLPTQRMATMRFIKQLIQLYPKPLSKQDAYSGSTQARLGLNDDGFMSEKFGYYDSDPEIRQKQIDYQAQATRYVVMSGEPGTINEKDYSYGLKADPFVQLTKNHWSSLNYAMTDAPLLYKIWKENGVYDEIGDRLGYRFSLVAATVPKQVQPGDAFNMTFSVKNSGFARPHNQRPVEVVLRNTKTKQEYYLPVDTDPRQWKLGNVTPIQVTGELPVDMVAGEYGVFLNLFDPAPKLSGRPEYSIRLANDKVWENYSGYNSLLTSVKVDSSVKNGGSSGTNVFQQRTNLPKQSTTDTITLKPTLSSPKPASAPILKEGDVLVDFQDRSSNNQSLIGIYGGIDWGANNWYTKADSYGRYLYVNGSKSAAATFTLPEGKVLKSLSLRKLNRDGTVNQITLSSEGNSDYVWDNPAPWWSPQHELSWRNLASKVTFKLTSDSSNGVGNILIDNIVYGNPPPKDVVVDFEDLQVGGVLKGMYGGVNWDNSGLWKVGKAEDGNTFIYMDSNKIEQELTFTLPAGMVFKGLGMSKRAGESANDGDRVFFFGENAGVVSWSWIPIGGWNNDYGLPWSEPSGTVKVRVAASGKTDYNASNIMIGFIKYGAP